MFEYILELTGLKCDHDWVIAKKGQVPTANGPMPNKHKVYYRCIGCGKLDIYITKTTMKED